MTGSTDPDRAWQRSSIGITPLTIRPRAGQRRVNKFDLIAGAPEVQGQGQGDSNKGSSNPSLVASARAGEGEGEGRSEVVVLPSSSTRSFGAAAAAGAAGARVCSVCVRASADYTCPRCLIGYCSSKCYKAHGSSCTEAFFRGHVERETRLREEEEIERSGSGGKDSGVGPKQGRRASMVEVLRRIRHGHRGGTGNGSSGSGSGSGNRAQPAVSWEEGEADRQEDEDGGEDSGGGDGEDDDFFVERERLEALALALEQRGHTPPTGPSPGSASTAAVGSSSARDPKGNTSSSSSSSSFSSDVRRSDDCGDGGAGGSAWNEARDQERRGEPRLNDGDDEGMLDLLTAEERGRFLREVASGRLGKLIVPWVPWWTQTARVQEVTTMTAGGRTSHSLPPPVVDPCCQTAVCSFGGQDNQADSPPTRPSTPEEQQQQCSGSELANGGSSSGRRDSIGSSSSSSSGSSRSANKNLRGGGTAAAAVAAATSPNAAGNSSSGRQESPCTRHSFASLLSQPFRGAPDFSTICAARRPSPTLPALAADLVYAYALAARLYNGCWCSDPVGASLALVGASPVLKDGATPATVGQALTACVERAVEGEGAGYRDYAESLREDVRLLCSDPRKLVCAFQDAWGMLEAAGRTLAPSTKPLLRPAANGGGGGSRGKDKKAQRRAAKELGKVEKRIGYFLLWARSHGAEAAPQMLEGVEVLPGLVQQRGRAITIAA